MYSDDEDEDDDAWWEQDYEDEDEADICYWCHEDYLWCKCYDEDDKDEDFE